MITEMIVNSQPTPFVLKWEKWVLGFSMASLATALEAL